MSGLYLHRLEWCLECQRPQYVLSKWTQDSPCPRAMQHPDHNHYRLVLKNLSEAGEWTPQGFLLRSSLWLLKGDLERSRREVAGLRWQLLRASHAPVPQRASPLCKPFLTSLAPLASPPPAALSSGVPSSGSWLSHPPSRCVKWINQ